MNTKTFFLLSWCIFGLGLFFYLKGIFLVKSTITTYSDPSNRYAPALNLTTSSQNKEYLTSFINTVNSNPHPKFEIQSVVFLLIDALRPDFAMKVQNPTKNYHNILRVLERTQNLQSLKTRFELAYSDPPTVTIQRIKGMMTGSLPTFIQFGDNFAATSLQEDSFPNQVHLSGLNSYFVGDDTWEFLFPNRFNQTYPMDSFNVKDLDTVDQAVFNKLTQAVKQNIECLKQQKECFQLLAGHMLGVDHIGHYLHANHPEMKRKLKEIEQFLTELLKIIKDTKTMLIVVSDHGMTEGGNHGGASPIETQSVFFTYSPQGYLLNTFREIPEEFLRYPDPSITEDHRYMSQIDYISTMSAILNHSIPFVNLGSIMIEALPPFNPEFLSEFEESNLVHKLIVLEIFNNYAQICLFLKEYGEENQNEATVIAQFLEVFKADSNASQLASIASLLKKEKREILAKLRSKWAEFDLVSLRIGTIILISLAIGLIGQELFMIIVLAIFKKFNPILLLISLVHIEYCYSLFSKSLIVKADSINPLFSMQLVLITAGFLIWLHRLKRKTILMTFALLLLLKASRLFDQRLMLEGSHFSFINLLKQKYIQFYGDDTTSVVFTLYYILLHSIFVVNLLNNIIAIRKHDTCALLVFLKQLKEIAVLVLIFLYSHLGDRNYAYLVYVCTGFGFVLNYANYKSAPPSSKLLLFILFLIFDLTHLLLLLAGYKSVIIIFILATQLELVYRLAIYFPLFSEYILASFTYYFIMQGFFQTGHLTQFPTLQIANAFRGFQEFHRQIHTTLLLINTAVTPLTALLYASYLHLKSGLSFQNYLIIVMKLAIVFTVVTCVNTMWNRREMHFTSDYAPRLLFEVGINGGVLLAIGMLLFLSK